VSAFVRLPDSLSEDFLADAFNFNIHLDCGDTVYSTRNLEVHIAEEILQALNIRKNGDFAAFGILDKTHCDTRDGTLDGNAGVHKSKRGAADGSLRSRSVGRKNFGYESDCVREFVLGRNHRLESPFCQSAVTDFTSAGAS